MKNVFIIGSRGYHFNYGGWETFVSNLVDNYNDKETIFHIATITTKKEEKEIKINDNILVNPIYPQYSNFQHGIKIKILYFFHSKSSKSCVCLFNTTHISLDQPHLECS